MDSLNLKRHNSFQNNRKTTHSFVLRTLILKVLKEEVLKRNVCVCQW